MEEPPLALDPSEDGGYCGSKRTAALTEAGIRRGGHRSSRNGGSGLEGGEII